jgi:hypothetical protein
MKKYVEGVLILATVLLLSACETTRAGAEFVKSVKTSAGTPENSVLVYGMNYSVDECYYSQMDPKYEADFRSPEFSTDTFKPYAFCLGPVTPNTRYGVTFISATEYYYVGNHRYINQYKTFGSLQGTIFDIVVPSKPGLYYYGSYNAIYSIKNGKREKYEGVGMDDKGAELYCLKAITKAVKGTAWEPLVQKRIEELSK